MALSSFACVQHLLLRQLASLTADIEAAVKRGNVAQFFNCDANALAIKRHLASFDTIVSKMTVSNIISTKRL